MNFKARATAFGVAALVCAASAPAQNLYRCESGGQTTYQQQPCADGGKVIRALPPPTPEDARRANLELAIMRNQVIIGMTSDQVVRSWGSPTKINRTISSGSVSEQWVFRWTRNSTQYVYLENGRVSSIQD